MSVSDDIREHCLDTYITPARLRHDKGVFICVGDVITALGLTDRTAQVIGALGTNAFEEEAGVNRVHIEGPLNGTAIFTFLFR